MKVWESRLRLGSTSIVHLILSSESHSTRGVWDFSSHREGLIQVSDPPVLSRGNFLDCGIELDRRLLDYIVGLDTEINELVDGSVRDKITMYMHTKIW